MECLKDMWKLQKVEVEMVKLRKEWEQVKDLLTKEKRCEVDLIQKSIDDSRAQWQVVKDQYDQATEDIKEICCKLHTYNQQLYTEGSQSKQLLDIQEKIEQLTKRKVKLEDKQVAQIEELDQLEQRIANETCRMHRIQEQQRSRQNRLKQRQQEIKEAYQGLKQQREELREIIPGYMMVIYNDLVSQKKRPLAVLMDENCGGCGVAQTVLNVNALRKSGQYTRCNHCGRILVLESTAN